MKKKTIIIISAILGLIILIGVCSYTCVSYLTKSADNRQIVIEDLHSGSKKPLTNKGIYRYPQFSNNDDYIYFINRPPRGNKSNKSQLFVYSLKNMEIINLIIPNSDNISFTTSVLFDENVLCYLKNNTNENICLYSISDGTILQLTNDKNNKSNALISPNGKWISYIERNAETSRSNVCIIPSSGGQKIKISDSSGLISDVSIYCWTNDSMNICYITFLSLIIKSINGEIIQNIDLTGLVHFKNILSDPKNPDRLYLFARKSESYLTYSIFVTSIKEKKYKLWKENRAFEEGDYSISPDGLKLVYLGNI